MTNKDGYRESAVRDIMNRCVHFTGVQNKLCKSGVNIRRLVGGPDFGWATRLPCFEDEKDCSTPCDKRELPTREQAEAEETEHEDRMAKFIIGMKAAKADAKSKGLGRGNGGCGELPCPVDCGGTLRYSVAGVNGHMHASCTTKGCLSWME